MLPALFLTAGCGGDDPAAPNDGPRIRPEIITESSAGDLQTTFDVEWTDGTVVLDEDEVKGIEVDTITQIYYLPDDVSDAKNLKPGDVVIFTGVTFRKVKSVSTADGEIAIETEDALLTEAIKNGTVEWEFRPDFENAPPAEITVGNDVVSAGKVGYDPARSFDFKLAKYDFTFEVGCENPDQLSVSVTGKDPAGIAEYKISGEVSEFTGKGSFRIIDQELKSFEYVINDVSATLRKEMTVGSDIISTPELPVTLFKFPFLVGPLPMKLKFPLVFAAAMQLPLGGKVTIGTTTDYRVDIGYRFTPPDNFDLIFNKEFVSQEADSIRIVPNAAGFAEYAIAFPRVEWSFLGYDKIAYYIHLAYLMRGSYSQNDLAGGTCVQGSRTFAGVGGFFLNLFDVIERGWDVQLFAIDDVFYEEGCD